MNLWKNGIAKYREVIICLINGSELFVYTYENKCILTLKSFNTKNFRWIADLKCEELNE